MAIIKKVRGFRPVIGANCFIAETAAIIGDVTMGDDCSVWYSAVLRGDVNTITRGNKVNIQDGAVIQAFKNHNRQQCVHRAQCNHTRSHHTRQLSYRNGSHRVGQCRCRERRNCSSQCTYTLGHDSRGRMYICRCPCQKN